MTDNIQILSANTIAIAKRYLDVHGYGTWVSGSAIIAMVPGTMTTVRIWTEDIEAHLAAAVADDFGYPRGTAKLEAHGADQQFIEGILDLAFEAARYPKGSER